MPRYCGPVLVRGRAFAFALLAGVVAALALASPAVAADGEKVDEYATAIVINADASLDVTETITYDFGDNDRHGIIRRIPASFRYDDEHNRVYPISDVDVTMDGRPVEFERSSEGGYQIIKIGDPDDTISGAHTYRLRYHVTGALNDFADHTELYWNAVGNEWEALVAGATATVTAPVQITRAACYAGEATSRLPCDRATIDGTTASFAQGPQRPGEGLSIVVALPVGAVAATEPVLVPRRSFANSFRVTPVTVGVGTGLALAGVAGALLLAWRVGRDRRYVGLLPGLTPEPGEGAVEERQPLVGAPPVSVEFGAPDNVRPGQVGTLFDERAHVVDVTATIIDFAVRRHLRITELADKDWELTKLTDGDPTFLPYERELFDALFSTGDTVKLSDLKGTFAKHLSQVREALYADMVTQGWYRRSPEATRTVAVVLGFLAVGLSIAALILLGVFLGLGLIGVGLVVAAVTFLVVAWFLPARTGKGSAMLERVKGLRLYIATAEVAQLQFQEKVRIFSTFLPYAMVFGLAERWAGIFADLDLDTTGPDGTPGLYWYGGLAGWNLAHFNASIGSFATATTGTIASVPASSGSSGFSGGGGFVGGGAGGGGGGSW
ncbi:DUF2207 domain-containing protein [Luedemannella flava]